MERQIGLDFGATTSVVAYQDGTGGAIGHLETISFDGNPYLPSVILTKGTLTSKRGIEIHYDELFGWGAALKTQAHSLLKRNFKMDLIHNDSVIRQEGQVLTKKFFSYLYKQYTYGATIQKNAALDKVSTVVTYPAKFPEEVRQFLKEAAEEAGFQNVMLLDESKAAMAYSLEYETSAIRAYVDSLNKKTMHVMLIDMGAGTTDIAIFTYDTEDPTQFNTLCSWPEMGGANFGGDEIDQILCDFYKGQLGSNVETILGKGNQKLGEVLLQNQVKIFKEHVLSPELQNGDTVTDLPGSLDTMAFTMAEQPDTDLDRERFEWLLAAYLPEFPALVEGAMKKANLTGADIDMVLLTGGHSRWYFVKDQLETLGISRNVVFGFDDPHLAVAKGAACYAQSKKSHSKSPSESAESTESGSPLTPVSEPGLVPAPEKQAVIVERGSMDDFGIWTLDANGLLSIEGTGKMPDWSVGERPAPWDKIREQIQSVFISDTVTGIGGYAFSGCKNLTQIHIPDSVTSIGDGAFWYCTGLTQIHIPDSVTDIGSSAFCGCENLTQIHIPDSVISIGDHAFEYCTGLTQIHISDSVNSIGNGAFEHCTGLAQIHIPDSVTGIGSYAFHECKNLTQIYISDSVTDIGRYAFRWCENLTQIRIPDGVISIGEGAFEYCRSLTQIHIPDSVTSIGNGAFRHCTGLTQIHIPDSVTSIGNDTFEYCRSLTQIHIPDSVTSIGNNAFYDCKNLTQIHIPDSVTSIGEGAFEHCTSLTQIRIPDGITSIGDRVFQDCRSLTQIYNLDNVTSIGDYAFYFCLGLAEIHLSNGVTSIGNGAFKDCSSLTQIHIPYGVTNIGDRAFEDCTGLTRIHIPGSVTDIGEFIFKGCDHLKQVTMPARFDRVFFWSFNSIIGSFKSYFGIPKEIVTFFNPD